MEQTKKILLVEDDDEIIDFMKRYLLREKYAVLTAGNGQDALTRVREEEPDLVILDLMLPGIDGFEVIRELRKEYVLPILIVSARGDETDRVVGLELGADDYVTKPFSPRELVARVKALLRRSSLAPTPRKTIQKGNITIDFEKRKVYMTGREITLTPIEFALLKALSQNPGKVFSREDLLDRIWGQEFAGETRTVDVHIKNVRKKLEVDPDIPPLIRSVRGVGYLWEE